MCICSLNNITISGAKYRINIFQFDVLSNLISSDRNLFFASCIKTSASGISGSLTVVIKGIFGPEKEWRQL
jgi:hypothetical protein